MILIFDLDDTLYRELDFVESGFKAVAHWGYEQFKTDAAWSLALMLDCLKSRGRGAVFNDWLKNIGALSASNVDKAVTIYRHHKPTLELPADSKAILEHFKAHPLYIITDGHKIVQNNKIEALGLRAYVRHAYITHRYGVKHAKPSLHCFDLARKRHNADWSDLVYVGDNPRKDFAGLNEMGGTTVRIHQGMYKDIRAADGYDAQHHIQELADLTALLAG